MEKKKMTKRDYYGVLAELVKGTEMEDELTEFINREVEILNKKTNAKTSKQKENDNLVEIIYKVLVTSIEPMSIAELLKTNEIADAGIISSQKLSALLKKLVDSERIVKEYVKKTPYFKVSE